MVDGGGPTCWVGESGVRSAGKAVLQLGELAHHGVELAVGDGRRVEHVIAPARVVQPLAEIRVSLARLRQGRRKLDVSIAGRRRQDLFRHVGTMPARRSTAARFGLGEPDTENAQSASCSMTIWAAERRVRSARTASSRDAEASPQAGVITIRAAAGGSRPRSRSGPSTRRAT